MDISYQAGGNNQFVENTLFCPSIMDEECYYCACCNVKCTGILPFEQHISGAKHQRNFKSGQIVCSACNVKFNSEKQLDLHMNGAKHRRKIQIPSCVVSPSKSHKCTDTKLQKILDLEAVVSKKIDFHSSLFASVHSNSCPNIQFTSSRNFSNETFSNSSSSHENKVHHIFCENPKCVILRALKHYEDFLCSHCPADLLSTTSEARNLGHTD